MRTFLFIPLLFVFVLPFSVEAQEVSSEKSISKEEMPDLTISLLNRFWNGYKKADFYRQSKNDTISYEASVTWRGYMYSISFDENGSLLGVTKKIKFDALPEVLQNTITTNIQEQFSDYRIRKVQQYFVYNGDEKTIKLAQNRNVGESGYLVILELDGESRTELGYFELTFDVSGKLLQRHKLERRSLDNIW